MSDLISKILLILLFYASLLTLDQHAKQIEGLDKRVSILESKLHEK